jgi:ClpP class serine protease
VSSGFIGVDPAGVQAWKTRLDAKHAQVISVLNEYRALAQQNNDVAHGSHFTNINTQCEDITNKHVTDHTDLHSQYTTASNKLVQGVMDVAGA